MSDGKSVVIDGETFQVDMDAYSGPLDMLVDLVRLKKVDVAAVPVLEIVEQFLSWMRTVMNARLELAAEWLLLAATLAHMKSRLLLPASKEERGQAEAVVEDFMQKLRRVQAVRALADELGRRRRLGVHWHAPGDAADSAKGSAKRMEATLFAMLAAYVREARITLRPPVAPVRKPYLVFTVEEAILMVESACSGTSEWLSILEFRHDNPPVDDIHARSRVASAYVASLELAKRGRVEVAQRGDAIEVRRRVGERA